MEEAEPEGADGATQETEHTSPHVAAAAAERGTGATQGAPTCHWRRWWGEQAHTHPQYLNKRQTCPCPPP